MGADQHLIIKHDDRSRSTIDLCVTFIVTKDDGEQANGIALPASTCQFNVAARLSFFFLLSVRRVAARRREG